MNRNRALISECIACNGLVRKIGEVPYLSCSARYPSHWIPATYTSLSLRTLVQIPLFLSRSGGQLLFGIV